MKAWFSSRRCFICHLDNFSSALPAKIRFAEFAESSLIMHELRGKGHNSRSPVISLDSSNRHAAFVCEDWMISRCCKPGGWRASRSHTPEPAYFPPPPPTPLLPHPPTLIVSPRAEKTLKPFGSRVDQTPRQQRRVQDRFTADLADRPQAHDAR